MPMHTDELPLPVSTAEELFRATIELPEATRLTVLEGAGTTSHVVRIGSDLLARFPLRPEDPDSARRALEAEHSAMRELHEVCPVPTPLPVALGEPNPDYPMPFSVQTWIEGELATPSSVADSVAFAGDLAALILALREAPTRGRTFTGPGRGGDLRAEDDWVQECLSRSTSLLPVPELTALWKALRDLPREDPDAMSHTDLIPANLLVHGDRLAGVLDTGGFRPADPALDLVGAWHLLDQGPRTVLREKLGEGELSWRRGAGWALAQAIGLVWYYVETNPMMAGLGRSTLVRLLEDAGSLTN